MREFANIPYAVLAATVLLFVLTCRIRWRTRIVWTLFLTLCCAKVKVCSALGGSLFYPELPAGVLWTWNWAYFGAIFLSVLALPFCLWRSPRKAWVLPAVAWTLSAVSLWNCIRPPAVHEVVLTFPGLPAELDGYRIAQVTDLHCSSEARGDRTRAVVERVNALGADLVCLLGDNVDGSVADRFEDLAPLRDLRAKDGVWAVTGNHESYFEPDAWQAAYRRLGIRFLTNACVFPRKSLALGGVNDDEADRIRNASPFAAAPDIVQAFAAATNGEFRVLMKHRPGPAAANLPRHGIDLQLSGHTHGGFMPGISRLVRNVNCGFLKGVSDFGGRKLCISNGVGQTVGVPLRLFAPSEIVLVVLRRPSAASDRR